MAPSFSIKAAKEAKADGVSIPKEGTKRPDGIPTVADMIDAVLADAERIGKDGLRGRDLIIGISDRWWPGVGWNSILPSAIRLVHKGRLGKRNGLYCRIDTKEHPVADQRPMAH